MHKIPLKTSQFDQNSYIHTTRGIFVKNTKKRSKDEKDEAKTH